MLFQFFRLVISNRLAGTVVQSIQARFGTAWRFVDFGTGVASYDYLLPNSVMRPQPKARPEILLFYVPTGTILIAPSCSSPSPLDPLRRLALGSETLSFSTTPEAVSLPRNPAQSSGTFQGLYFWSLGRIVPSVVYSGLWGPCGSRVLGLSSGDVRCFRGSGAMGVELRGSIPRLRQDLGSWESWALEGSALISTQRSLGSERLRC